MIPVAGRIADPAGFSWRGPGFSLSLSGRPQPIKEGSDIVTCAGKIHFDLARGFIKAEIVSYQDLMRVYNWQEARSRGLMRLVDRDYTIQEGDVIEIRFNV